MLSTQKTPENVTECIEILAYNDHLWEGFAPHEKDSKTIRSLAESPYAWTEKQAKLALVICATNFVLSSNRSAWRLVNGGK